MPSNYGLVLWFHLFSSNREIETLSLSLLYICSQTQQLDWNVEYFHRSFLYLCEWEHWSSTASDNHNIIISSNFQDNFSVVNWNAIWLDWGKRMADGLLDDNTNEDKCRCYSCKARSSSSQNDYRSWKNAEMKVSKSRFP